MVDISYPHIQDLPGDGNGYKNTGDLAAYLRSGLSGEKIQSAVLKLLGQTAQEIFEQKLNHYAAFMNIKYNSLEITDDKRIFSSSDPRTGHVILSRRLLLMSDEVIDSMIVSELAHIKYPSNDEEAYDEIIKTLPCFDDYEDEFYPICDYLLKYGWI